MLLRLDAVEHFLVKLGSEVASESVQLSLGLQHRETEATILAKGLFLTLGEVFELGLVRVWQMAESKDVLRGTAAGVRRAVDLHDVRQLVWVHLLLVRDSARDALVGIGKDFVPEDLAAEGH